MLEGECSPQESVNFWTKLGCSEYDGHSMFVNPHVRFVVERKFKFSKSLNRVNVSIEFLQADGLYEKHNFYLCQKFDIKGAIQPNGDIFLEKRVIGFKQNGLFSRVDLAVKIIVENKILCFCKVKDDEAIKCGVQRSKFDSSYFIDVLKT